MPVLGGLAPLFSQGVLTVKGIGHLEGRGVDASTTQPACTGSINQIHTFY